jgi:hypothetical protein
MDKKEHIVMAILPTLVPFIKNPFETYPIKEHGA